MDEFKKIINTVITELVDLSIKNIFMDDKIFTTPFDKGGVYDNASNLGECKFPFFDKNKKKFIYQCVPRNGGLMCPTKIDYHRKPDKWGYCPENIEETHRNMNVIDIDAVGSSDIGDKNGEYHAGKCNFPFTHKETSDTGEDIYKLKYDCNQEGKEGQEGFLKWCPIKPANIGMGINIKKTKKSMQGLQPASEIGDGDLLRAASKFENVKLNKWYSGKLSIPAITSKKYLKGYCQPPLRTKKLKQEIELTHEKEKDKQNNAKLHGEIEDVGEAEGEGEGEDGGKTFEITLENYIPNNCSGTITPSKGGYKRQQLFNFGKNYLKIPYTQLTKPSGEPLQKPELCRIINAKYREFKKRGREITDEDRIKAYEKNIEDCENGESKGGYSLNDLKELAINYYNIAEEKLKDMNKPQICDHIRENINRIKSDEDILSEKVKEKLQIENPEYKIGEKGYKDTMIYPGDINNCKETPNRGGFSVKKIKQIASEQFSINTEHKHKDEICDEISTILKENKKVIGRKTKDQRNTRLSASKIHQLRDSFSDLFDDPSIAAIPDFDDAEDIEELGTQGKTNKSVSKSQRQSNSQIKSIRDENNNEA